MKKLMVSLLIGCALVISQGFRKVAADDNRTPLRKLAGTYALTVHGSFVVCVESAPPHALVACGSAGSIGVPIITLAVGGRTLDTEGNACVTWTETETDSPVTVVPPTIFVVHQTAKITSYDPTTGTGEGSFTNYFGGTCQGATFDNTGATVAATGAYHFAVSNSGKRIDAVVTSVNNSVGAIGGFAISTTDLRE